MNTYIGVKSIEAKEMTLGDYNTYRGWNIPEDEDPARQGYLVKYSDDYESWSPKEVFEAAYLKLTDPTKITEDIVDNMIGEVETRKIDDKSTLVKSIAQTGFLTYEVSSCIDPKNYDEELGKTIGLKVIKNRIWGNLGFVLQWATNGLKGD